MASFNAGTTFTDGVANDVTAAKLGTLITAATPTSGFIQDRTAETATATNDTLLIGDASDSNNLKRITVANFAQTLPTAKITTGTIDTGTFGTTTSTAATITTGTITTGVIPTLTSTTKITSGTGTAGSPAISPTGDSNTGVFFPAADTIALAEGGTEAMRIDSSGNVGIGTTSPNDLLDLQTPSSNYSIRIRASSNNFALVRYVNNANNNTDAIIGTPAANTLALYTNGFNERLRIDSSGNVGIGTTSPYYKLSVNSSNGINSYDGVSGKGRFVLGDPSDPTGYVGMYRSLAGSIGTAGNDLTLGAYSSIAFTTGATSFGGQTERLRIDSSGNVGIGTTSPATILHISTTSIGGIRTTCGSSPVTVNYSDGVFGNRLNANNNYVINTSTGALYLQNDFSTDVFSVVGGGKFGIGTTTPVNKLEIVGSFGRGAPVTKVADFTLADTENWLIVNKGSSCTVTLPAASSWTGREFTIKVITAHTVVSASSNVVPRNSATAGTAILAATAGSWATLVSNGTNWVIMCGS